MTSTPEQPASSTPPVPRPPRAGGTGPIAELEALETLAQRPLGEHVEVFDTVHRVLSEQLRGAES